MGRASALVFAREGALVVGCDLSVGVAQATVELMRGTGGEGLQATAPSHRTGQLPGAGRPASVEDAISAADAVLFAVWLDVMTELIPAYAGLLAGKVVIDPSNPIGFDAAGQMTRTLPDGKSSGSVVAALLPAGAHYVKAFGTLGADALAASANRDPLAVLFYATDDDTAAITIERLIRVAGCEPWKAGGVAAAGRIEAPGGDLHQYGFNGEVVDINRARSATAGSAA
jgi:8-hydroxy-5-deazaflavin:NADPH oxidoreductase